MVGDQCRAHSLAVRSEEVRSELGRDEQRPERQRPEQALGNIGPIDPIDRVGKKKGAKDRQRARGRLRLASSQDNAEKVAENIHARTTIQRNATSVSPKHIVDITTGSNKEKTTSSRHPHIGETMPGTIWMGAGLISNRALTYWAPGEVVPDI